MLLIFEEFVVLALDEEFKDVAKVGEEEGDGEEVLLSTESLFVLVARDETVAVTVVGVVAVVDGADVVVVADEEVVEFEFELVEVALVTLADEVAVFEIAMLLIIVVVIGAN